MEKPSNIVWEYTGKPDLFTGTEATVTEKLLAWTGGLIGTGILLFFYWTKDVDWTIWQYIFIAIIAFDLVAGVVANSLNSCKRFYHSSVKTFEPSYIGLAKNHLFFSLIHVYPLLISLIFPSASWFYSGFWYLFLQASVLAVIKTPLYLQRPVSMLIIVTTFLINSYLIIAPAGFEWVVPVLFLKIVYAHTVKEEPYRPETEKAI